MGGCVCKDKILLNQKTDIEVPSCEEEIIITEYINMNLEVNERNNEPEEEERPRISKQFLKLKTHNDPKKMSLSTEKLLLRGKTIKGGSFVVVDVENESEKNQKPAEAGDLLKSKSQLPAGSPRQSQLCEKKSLTSSRQNDLLRKPSEKNEIIENPDEIAYSVRSVASLKEEPDKLVYTLSKKDVIIEQADSLIRVLKNHHLFKGLSDNVLKSIVDEMTAFQIESGTYIFREGEEGTCFFIILKGKMEVSVNGERKKILTTHDCFGELALIHKCMRSTSIMALTDVEFFVLDGALFRELNQNFMRMKMGDVLFYIDLIPWLKSLDNTIKTTLARLTVLHEYNPGQKITSILQNEEKIYIIKQGLASAVSKFSPDKIRLYHRDYFGEKWIFEDSHFEFKYEIYEAYTLEKTSVYIIPKSSIEEALGMNYKEIILRSFFNTLISYSKFFMNFFVEKHYDDLFDISCLKYYSKGQTVFDMSFNSNKKVVYILEGGLVDNSNYEVLATRGEVYGEEIIHTNEDLPNSIAAFPECLCIESTWDAIRSELKAISKTSSLDIFSRLSKLRKVFLFKHISESRGLEICNLMVKETFQKGEFLFHDNSPGDKFYLINKGRVQVIRKGKVVRELEESSCFGELALLNEEKRTASILALEKVQCYTLTKERFLDIIDENIMEYLKNKICLEDADVKLNNLYYLSFLGKGKFGSVHLVHNSNYLYAIKVISRKIPEKQKSICKYLISEKRILLSLDHPFIVKLVKTLKTENFLFFLMEFVNGLSLEEYLQNRKVKKNVHETRFYGACLLVILDYLNSKSIAHRDIKPQNIMIDCNGYLKLIDFGTAKKINDFTHTVVGTPHFTAPEVLAGKGYSLSCDYWSVGVCMFYTFYGVLPYGSLCSDIMEVYKEILHKDVTYPDSANAYDINSFLNILLSKKVSNRMCNLNSLKYHNLYKDFNFDDLIDFKLKPSYVPKNLREWRSNLKNFSHPLESMLNTDKFNHINTNNLNNLHDEKIHEIPQDYDKKWLEDF